MAKTLELTFPDGGCIAVEVADVAAGTERGFDDVMERVTAPFESALSSLQGIADGLQATMKRAVSPPDAVTVKFGVNFSAESGLMIAKGTAGANLEITMEWTKAQPALE